MYCLHHVKDTRNRAYIYDIINSLKLMSLIYQTSRTLSSPGIITYLLSSMHTPTCTVGTQRLRAWKSSDNHCILSDSSLISVDDFLGGNQELAVPGGEDLGVLPFNCGCYVPASLDREERIPRYWSGYDRGLHLLLARLSDVQGWCLTDHIEVLFVGMRPSLSCCFNQQVYHLSLGV